MGPTPSSLRTFFFTDNATLGREARQCSWLDAGRGLIYTAALDAHHQLATARSAASGRGLAPTSPGALWRLRNDRSSSTQPAREKGAARPDQEAGRVNLTSGRGGNPPRPATTAEWANAPRPATRAAPQTQGASSSPRVLLRLLQARQAASEGGVSLSSQRAGPEACFATGRCTALPAC